MKVFNLLLAIGFAYMILSEWNDLDMRFKKEQELKYEIVSVSKTEGNLAKLTIKDLKTKKEYDLRVDYSYKDIKKMNLSNKNIKVVNSLYANNYGKKELKFQYVVIKDKKVDVL